MKKALQKRITTVCIMITIICLGIYIYIPRHIEFSIEIRERDSNKAAMLYADLKKRYYITKPNSIEGTITIGNELFYISPVEILGDLWVNKNNIANGFRIKNENYSGRVNLVYEVNDIAIRIYDLNDELIEYWNGKISDIDTRELSKLKE